MGGFAEQARGTADRGVPVTPQFFFNPYPETDYVDLMVACIRKVMTLRNRDVMYKAIARVNAKVSNHSIAIVPPSHEWSDLEHRLLFLRYYTEAVDEMFGDGNSGEAAYLKAILNMEVEYENQTRSHYRVYQALTEKVYGRRFRAPDPPAPEPEPELDEDTKAILAKNQVKEKLQAYMQSLSQGQAQADLAYTTLVRAYVDTVSDLSVPLRMEYDDQKERAEAHNWIEWAQANEFPYQYENLFSVLYTLLNQARDLLKQGQTDQALQQLETAQSLYDHLATLLYDYYSLKVKRGRRVVIAILILKSISRIILSIVVFKNVKGLISQLAALIAINLLYQQLDHSIGVRDRGLSGREAVKDAALELLTAKVTGKVSELLAVRFNIDPKSLSFDAMNALVGTVIGGMEQEFMKLGHGVSFVGFLKNLRDKFKDPAYWIETVAMTAISRSYTTKGTVSLPMSPKFAQAATVAAVLTFAPKASASTPSGKPMLVEVVADAPASSGGAKTGDAAVAAKATSSTDVQSTAAAKPAASGVAHGAPTQQQRATTNVTSTPSTDPGTPAKSPLTPLSGVAMLGMAAAAGRNSKRGKILKLFEATKKMIDKINDPQARKEIEDRLRQLRKDFDNGKTQDETKKQIQAIKNRINEIYAEEQIDFLVDKNKLSFFVKKIFSKVAVPNRGSKGPDIIDMVYKVLTTGGKIAFLLIESKYGSAKLGWVRYGKRWVRQFSPEWFEMRIEEIRLKNPAFAQELADAWKQGRILPFVVKIAADGTPKSYYDYSAEWSSHMQAGKTKLGP